MGLDQYIYRISKPNLANKVYTSEEIDTLGLNKVSATEFESDISLFKDLLPYVVKRDVTCQFYDKEKMIADYNLPKQSYIWQYSNDGITIGGTDKNGERINKKFSRKEIEEKYTKTETFPYYIWEEEEVEYWRKHYGLQDWAYANIDGVDNTAYCKLSLELIANLNRAFNEYIPAEEPTEKSALFYWEWY